MLCSVSNAFQACSEYACLLLVALIVCSAQAARDEVLAYTQERKQFGKPLVDFQAVQLRLAEMEMKTTAARLLIHAAASRAVGISTDRLSARETSLQNDCMATNL